MVPINVKLDRQMVLSKREHKVAKQYYAAVDAMAEGTTDEDIEDPNSLIDLNYGVKKTSVPAGSFRQGLHGINDDLGFVEPPDHLNQAERKFVLAYVQAIPTVAAYDAAFDPPADRTNAEKWNHIRALLGHPKTQNYIDALNKRVEDLAVAQKADIERWLTEAIFTPFDEIGTDSSLCTGATINRTFNEHGEVTGQSLKRTTVNKAEAVKLLNRMRGYDQPVKLDVNHSGGVMVVPMVSSEDDWTKIAEKSQQELIETTIDV